MTECERMIERTTNERKIEMKKMKIVTMIVAMAVLAGALAYSATITNMTSTATSAVYRGPATYVAKATVNFATRGAVTSDVVQIISVPAGSTVLALCYEITTASAVDTTVDIGDGDSATLYASNASLTNDICAVGYSAGKIYDAADTIDMTMDGSPTNGIIDVWALIMTKP
jgi:hypothetical protein